jgi:hypothetical protein
MAEPVENKGDLTDKLEADRQEMAIQVGELQQSYNVPRWFRASVQDYPWRWMLGAVFFGLLLSRLPARKKRVYVYVPANDGRYRNATPLQGKGVTKLSPEQSEFSERQKKDLRLAPKLWSLTKPILTTYLAREIYDRLIRSRSDPSTT